MATDGGEPRSVRELPWRERGQSSVAALGAESGPWFWGCFGWLPRPSSYEQDGGFWRMRDDGSGREQAEEGEATAADEEAAAEEAQEAEEEAEGGTEMPRGGGESLG